MKQKILKFIYNFFAFFARIYLKRTKPEIIWITWSVGKTSCRMIIYWTLKQKLTWKKIYTSPKNYNSEIWIICSIFQIEDYKPNFFYILKMFFKIIFKTIFANKNYDILILEYWVDKPKDMDFLLKVAKSDISIFTKLDFIHVANFSSQNELWNEKSKLIFNAKKTVFLNKKDDFQKNIFPKINIEKYFYNAEKIDFSYKKIDSKIFSFLKYNWVEIKTNLLWEENLVYLELSFMILEKFWFDFKSDFLELNYDLQNGRFSVFEGKNNSVLVDSTYNSWPESMRSMILNLKKLQEKIFFDYKIIFVLWDMREIWENSEKKHKELFDFASQFWEIISVWEQTKNNFWKHLWNFKYSADAWDFLEKFLDENKKQKYLILFKWSQNTIFLEECLKKVLKNKSDEKFLVRQENYWKKRDF